MKRIKRAVLALLTAALLALVSACGFIDFDLSGLFPSASPGGGTASPSPSQDTGPVAMYPYVDVTDADAMQNTDLAPHLIRPSERESAPFRAMRDDASAFPAAAITGATAADQAEDLFNKVSCGYRPVCKVGSWAEALYAEALKTLDAILLNDMTEYERVHAIYDWTIACVQYDYDLLELYEKHPGLIDDDDPAFNLLGVFRDRVAVCDGLSKAFTLLCRIENIPCVRVVGEAGSANGSVSSSERVGHAWNKVFLHRPDVVCGDEESCTLASHREWYICDPTWGNLAVLSSETATTPEMEVLVHNYLLVSDAEISGTHFEYRGASLALNDPNFKTEFPGKTSYPTAPEDYGYYELPDETGLAPYCATRSALKAYFDETAALFKRGAEFKTSLPYNTVRSVLYESGAAFASMLEMDGVYLLFS